MNDERLQEDLRRLGLDHGDAALVALLPLVEVAWSDGSVADTERERILEAATSHGLLDAHGQELLAGWLSEQPSAFFLDTGRRVLQELGRRGDVPIGGQGIVALCFSVADAAGGLFGFGTISATEREAIGRIAELLRVPDDLDWRSYLQDN